MIQSTKQMLYYFKLYNSSLKSGTMYEFVHIVCPEMMQKTKYGFVRELKKFNVLIVIANSHKIYSLQRDLLINFLIRDPVFEEFMEYVKKKYTLVWKITYLFLNRKTM